MFYGHSEMIAGRIDLALELIETGDHSTKTLAAELGISIPTASRVISALRQRGYSIKSVKNGKAWAYRLMSPKQKSRAISQEATNA